jgi:hypothetical protein
MSPRDWAESHYSRVYASIPSDPKFAHVYHDDAALATWLRLLLAADASWPQPAAVPRRTDQRPLDQLAAAGLVDLLPGDLFLIHGLDAERHEKAAQATEAGKKRAALGTRNARGQYVKDQRPLDVPPATHQRPLDTQPATHQLTVSGSPLVSGSISVSGHDRPATAGPSKEDDERLAEYVAGAEYIRTTGILPDPARPSHPERVGAILAGMASTFTPTPGATP